MFKPVMMLVCGMSACGKTDYAKAFAKANGYVYLSPDALSATIHDNPVAYEDKFEVWMMIYRTLHLMEQKGKNVVLDSNCLKFSDREQLTTWFPGFHHVMTYIEASRDFRLKHNALRDRNIPEESLLKMEENLQRPDKKDFKVWHMVTMIENSEEEPYKIVANYVNGQPKDIEF